MVFSYRLSAVMAATLSDSGVLCRPSLSPHPLHGPPHAVSCQAGYLRPHTIDMCPQESSTLFGRFGIHVALIVGERHLGIHHHVPVIGEVQDEVGYQSLAFIVLQSLSKTVTKRLLRIKLLSLVQLHILEQLPELQFAIMCAPTTSQYAAVEALKNGDEDVAMMREQYDARRRYLMERFKEMGLECFEPFGAFYVFPCIKEFGMTSDEFANRLLQTKKVAVVPGTAFGDSGEGFIRISYAYSLDDLKIALERVEEFITELRANK